MYFMFMSYILHVVHDNGTNGDMYIAGAAPNVTCRSDRFECQSSRFGLSCIPNSWKCDGEADCDDGSDELHCHNMTCHQDEFEWALSVIADLYILALSSTCVYWLLKYALIWNRVLLYVRIYTRKQSCVWSSTPTVVILTLHVYNILQFKWKLL